MSAPRRSNPWYDRGCRFGRWLRRLSPEDLARVKGWLADPAISDRALADYINSTSPDTNFNRQNIWHHRKDCRCEPL